MTTQTVTIDTASAAELTETSKSILESAVGMVVDSPTMLEIASEDLKNVVTLEKAVEAQRTSITKPLNDALKAVNALFKAPAEYLGQAKADLKRAILTYTAEQERLAAAARREAEKKAQAERDRLAAEAAKQAEEAKAAAAAGDHETAAALEETAESNAQLAEVLTFTPAVIEAPKVSGISGQTRYSAKVEDLLALVKAVAAGNAPIEAIAADEKFLNAQARAYKKVGQLYPGVTVVAERTLSARFA